MSGDYQTPVEIPVPEFWDGARFEYKRGFEQGAAGQRLSCPIRMSSVDGEFRRDAWKAGHRDAKRLLKESQ